MYTCKRVEQQLKSIFHIQPYTLNISACLTKIFPIINVEWLEYKSSPLLCIPLKTHQHINPRHGPAPTCAIRKRDIWPKIIQIYTQL